MLLDVSPCGFAEHVANSASRDSELLREFDLLQGAGSPELPDLDDGFFVEHRAGMSRTSGRSPLDVSVRVVLSARSFAQMVEAYTWAIVTSVKDIIGNAERFDLPIEDPTVCPDMSRLAVLTVGAIPETAVSLGDLSSDPYRARSEIRDMRGNGSILIHATPESGNRIVVGTIAHGPEHNGDPEDWDQ